MKHVLILTGDRGHAFDNDNDNVSQSGYSTCTEASAEDSFVYHYQYPKIILFIYIFENYYF